MAKNLMILGFLIVLGHALYPIQPSTIDLEKRVVELERQVQKASDENEMLAQNVKGDLAHYSETFNRWMGIQSILIALLGLFTLGVPIITWIFAVVPTLRLKKKLKNQFSGIENTVNLRIEAYLNLTENLRFNVAIEGLQSQDPRIWEDAYVFLKHNAYFQVNDENRKSVFDLIMGGRCSQHEDVLIRILLNKETPYAEKVLPFLFNKGTYLELIANVMAKYSQLTLNSEIFEIVDKCLDRLDNNPTGSCAYLSEFFRALSNLSTNLFIQKLHQLNLHGCDEVESFVSLIQWVCESKNIDFGVLPKKFQNRHRNGAEIKDLV